jgi:hypothetical protein
MLERMYQRAMVGPYDSLSEYEVDLGAESITIDPKPKKARAWVRYSGSPVRANVYVLAWTAHAVRVRWQQPDGVICEAWVWSPAVREAPWEDAD